MGRPSKKTPAEKTRIVLSILKDDLSVAEAAQRSIDSYFASAEFQPAPIVDLDLSIAPIVDWSVDPLEPAAVPEDGIALGRWRERRAVCETDDFITPFGDRRTLHMGIDLLAPRVPS